MTQHMLYFLKVWGSRMSNTYDITICDLHQFHFQSNVHCTDGVVSFFYWHGHGGHGHVGHGHGGHGHIMDV